ncbi:DnaD domain protein [Lactobacillus sp. AN1001]
MARIKKLRQKNFTIVDNTVIDDTELSWKAKGVFLYLWSKSDEWQFYEVEVAKHAKDGRDSLRSALKELETKGYLKRVRNRNDKGQVTTSDWILSEKPMSEKATQENPMQENDTLPSTDLTKDLSNQEINNNNNEQADASNAFVAFQTSGATLNGFTMPQFVEYVNRLGDDLVKHAIELMSVTASKPSFSYLKAILDSYENAGITTVEQAEEMDRNFKEKREQRRNSRQSNNNAPINNPRDLSNKHYGTAEEIERQLFEGS